MQPTKRWRAWYFYLSAHLYLRTHTGHLIMSRRLPDFFLHIGGTHIHHLNYGIFLLCATGAYLLFARPTGGRLRMAAILHAMGLALTFDEFGMWLNLGGSYWQRSSYDAVAVIMGFMGFIAYFPVQARTSTTGTGCRPLLPSGHSSYFWLYCQIPSIT